MITHSWSRKQILISSGKQVQDWEKCFCLGLWNCLKSTTLAKQNMETDIIIHAI